MKKYLEGLQPKLKDDLTSEKDAINEACASLSAKEGREVTPLELAAVLLKEKMDDPGSALSEERDYSKSHNASIERNKEKKRFVTDPNNQRFFINVGFEDGANEDNLKSFIIGETKGLKTSDFADIYLKGTFSFFELPKAKGDEVIAKVENSSFNGKNVHVEKTERPSEGAPKEKRYGKPSYAKKRYGDDHFSRDHHSFHGKRH